MPIWNLIYFVQHYTLVRSQTMNEIPSTSGLEILPENSQGELADNPYVLAMWQTGGGILEVSEWPYLMLCRDRNGDFTWHMLCNDHNIPRLIAEGHKSTIDWYISYDRERNLQGIELLCRKGFQHTFLK